jgi:hypothetical protein
VQDVSNNDRFKINKNTFVQNVLHQSHNYNINGDNSIVSQCPGVCPGSENNMNDFVSDLGSDLVSDITSNPVSSGVKNFINTIGSRSQNLLNSGENSMNDTLGNIFVPGGLPPSKTTPLANAFKAMF